MRRFEQFVGIQRYQTSRSPVEGEQEATPSLVAIDKLTLSVIPLVNRGASEHASFEATSAAFNTKAPLSPACPPTRMRYVVPATTFSAEYEAVVFGQLPLGPASSLQSNKA